MSTNEDWNVEKHKLEHECDEHWELRKSFLETHKDKFPEEQLVCLAQVFTNVELLGCRYPKETMDLVADLSKDVAHDYRERQKSKIQRTFVKASDAASSKVKGTLNPPSHTGPTTSIEPPSKKQKTIGNCKESTRKDYYKKIFKDFVIMQHPNNTPQTIIDTSARMNGKKIEWKCSITTAHKSGKPLGAKSPMTMCELFVNNQLVDYSYGNSKKEAKSNVATKVLGRLSKTYHTIETKEDWKSSLLVKQVTLKTTTEPTEELFHSDNVGVKLMKSMGWKGGGLGKSQQGVFEPVTLERQVSRSGVGMKLDSTNMNEFKKKCHEALMKFIREGNMHDHLAFPDFSNEERAIMHGCASKLGLKSESYGPKDHRILLISLKMNPSTLLKQLIAIGGNTEKYVLREPHKIEKIKKLPTRHSPMSCDTDSNDSE